VLKGWAFGPRFLQGASCLRPSKSTAPDLDPSSCSPMLFCSVVVSADDQLLSRLINGSALIAERLRAESTSVFHCGILPGRAERSCEDAPYSHSCCNAVRLLLAQSGHPSRTQQCPLLGVKRTSGTVASMSAFDPKRTFSGRFDLPTR